MKITIAQFYTNNLSHGEYAEAINKKYCEEKGYKYYVDKDNDKIIKKLEGRSPTWYKPHLLLDVLNDESVDYVLFLDTDAIISDFNQNIEDFIDKNFNMVVAKDNSNHSLMNGGVLMFKNCSWTKKFLNDWWIFGEKVSPNKIKNLSFSENDKLNNSYFKDRLWMDQTILTYLYENFKKYSDKIKIIDDRSFNWYRYNDNNFIFHAYAYGAIKNRTLDIIHNQIFNIKLDINNESLIDLSKIYHTDKHYTHNYFNEVYQNLFYPIKNDVKKFVELGVHEGGSIKIWREFFKESKIIGLDCSINPNHFNDLERIELESINSGIKDDLINFSNKHNDIDIFMDDGSHIMYDQQITLATIFKSLKSNGLYILEDLHTSRSVLDNDISIWGDKNNTTTLEMLENFNKTGKIKSTFLNKIECEYLENNIKSCEIYKLQPNWSYTSVIIKK